MDLADPSLISHVRSAVSGLSTLWIGLLSSGYSITYNHITIQIENVLSLLIGFLGVGLLFALAVQRLGERHNFWASLLGSFGGGFVIVMPAVVLWVAITPSLTYGTPYWNYLLGFWYVGLVAIT